MGKITASCPNCKVSGAIDDSYIGKRIKCGKCNSVFSIPVTVPPLEFGTSQDILQNSTDLSNKQQNIITSDSFSVNKYNEKKSIQQLTKEQRLELAYASSIVDDIEKEYENNNELFSVERYNFHKYIHGDVNENLKATKEQGRLIDDRIKTMEKIQNIKALIDKIETSFKIWEKYKTIVDDRVILLESARAMNIIGKLSYNMQLKLFANVDYLQYDNKIWIKYYNDNSESSVTHAIQNYLYSMENGGSINSSMVRVLLEEIDYCIKNYDDSIFIYKENDAIDDVLVTKYQKVSPLKIKAHVLLDVHYYDECLIIINELINSGKFPDESCVKLMKDKEDIISKRDTLLNLYNKTGITHISKITNQLKSRQNKPRSKMVAGILGIIFGMFGIHRFYLGYTWIGIIQFFINPILVAVTNIEFIGFIWGITEGILILTRVINKDAKGNQLV